MATWKKIIVSGSNISQLNNDSLYIHTGSSGVSLTGSFTGSFVGDGSGLTGVTADGTLSSSAQIASDISGAFASDSSSLASRITANESFSSSLSTTVISYTGSFAGDGSGLSGITVDQNATVTASFSNAATASITHNFDSDNIIVVVYDDQDEQFIPQTIKAKTADVVEIHFTPNATGRAIVARGGHIVSGSIPYENLLNVPANIVSGSGQILVVTTGSGVLSGSAQIASDISGSFVQASSSIATDINALQSFSSSVDGALTISGQNVTVKGDLTVAGTTTTVNSTTVDIGDNIISLNGTGATNGGIEVNDGPASGSLLWDGTANQWIAGAKGSEEKILLAVGDGVLSGSAQIADNISGSVTSLSSSIETRLVSIEGSVGAGGLLSSSAQIASDISGSFVNASSSIATDIDALQSDSGSFSSRITAQEAFSSSLDATFATEAELNTATSSLSASLATDIATLDSGKADKTAITGAFAQSSGSFSTRVTSLEAFSSSLDATFATEAEVNTATSSLSASLAIDISTKADKTAISGAFTSTSSSIASDIAGLVIDSGSFSTRVTSLEAFSSSLDATFATEAEVNAATSSLSSSLAADIAQNKSDLANLTSGELNSGSFNVTLDPVTGSLQFTEGLHIGDVYDQGSGTTDIRVPNGAAWLELNYGDTDFIYLDGTDAGITLDNNYQWTFYGATGTFIAPGEIRADGTISGSKFVLTGGQLLSGSAQLNTIPGVAAAISGSFTATSASIATDIAALDSSKADKTAITGAFAQASASIATEIDALQASVGGGGLLSSSAQIADDISGSFGTVSSSLASRIVSNDADIAGLNTYSSSLKTALTVSGQNVTVVGNLTVSGTTTTVNSTTVDIGDNIIALNGTGATKGGLAVNDGPDSGSLLWDGTNNYWIAGPSGSETKVFVAGATGDGLLSGSAQIADNISGSFTDVSASIATDIAALDSGKADKTAVTGAFAQASGSFSTRVTSLEASVGAGGLLSSSAQIADDISGSLGTNATLIRSLTAATISGSFTLTSASIATDIAGLDSSKADKTAVSGAFTLTSSSIASDIAGLVVDSGSFSTRVTDLETFSSSLDASFVTEAELVAATSSLSSSLASDIAQNVTDIASNLSLISGLQAKSLISQSVLSSNGQGQALITNNGVAGSTVDLGLQTTDSPTFAGLTVTGDLIVTGNTVEAQVTNLNVEDKFILLNSGSTSGDSGIVFGGADGVANSGVGLFWDSSYNSNDGRLAIVNAMNAGATGDQTPSYHIAGVFEGSELFAGLAQADHVGNIRVDGGEIYIYV